MKKIKALLGSLAIAAILGANGYMAMSGTKAQSELTLEGVERVAQGWEWSDVMPGNNWRTELVHKHCILDIEESSGFSFSWNSSISFKGVTFSCGPSFSCNGTTIKHHVDHWYQYNTCAGGPGDCWSSDNGDCVKLYEKLGD